MESDAKWLLEKQGYFRAREGILKAYIEAAEKSFFGRDETITEVTFASRPADGSQKQSSQSSRTEYVALNLDEIYERSRQDQETLLLQWKRELKLVRHWLSILDAALMALTEDERVLVRYYYCEGKSLELISQLDLFDIPRSRSTLKRMLKSIVAKVEKVIELENSNAS